MLRSPIVVYEYLKMSWSLDSGMPPPRSETLRIKIKDNFHLLTYKFYDHAGLKINTFLSPPWVQFHKSMGIMNDMIY